MLDIIIAIVAGLVFGVVAGLLPGLHPNNTIPIILGLTSFLSPLQASVLLISTGVSNIFVNFIPSVLLGAPEDSNVLGVLPGHRLLLEGKGFEAIKLSVMGAFFGMMFSIAVLPLFALFISTVYEFIRPNVHYILIPIVIYMIAKEKGYGKVFAILTFFLSGLLGILVLDYSDAMLFPLLSGLFGMPTLLISITSKTSLPKKFEDTDITMKNKDLIKASVIGSLSGIIAGLLPGLGAAQSTALTQQVFKENDGRKFLVSIGAVASSDLIYSIMALYLIGNPRSGIAVAVSTLMEVGFNEVLLFLSIILAVSGISVVITLKMTKFCLQIMRKVDYQMLCASTMALIFIMIFIFSGLIGLIVSIIAMCIGLIPNYTNVRRTHSMGCLLLPTILWFAAIRLI
ncbi:MAG: tripartite tricarboxylate transporter permease [Nanoarchaeota archaeon]|nr:tripartite tricarboxylate transporter permease [Nanoarchaeota archaeon]MBU4124394.1 tripartite tricarboxylate transporter permease [Nanoarchaeota archaeon]